MSSSKLNKRLPETVSMEELFADRAQNHGIMSFGDIILAEKRLSAGNSGIKTRVKHLDLHVASQVKDVIEAGKLLIKGLKSIKVGAKFFCFHIPEKGKRSFVAQGENFKWQAVPAEKYKRHVPLILSKKASWLKGFRMGGIEFSGVWIAFPLKGNALAKARQEMKSLGMVVAGTLTSILKDPVELAKFTGLKDKNNRRIDIYLELGRWD